ncbi:ActR/RegA family two-component response regulator [Rhizobium mesoamericanum]|nr:ActR/RegA family two-component response regulator [Rhizobium mesoamericanum]
MIRVVVHSCFYYIRTAVRAIKEGASDVLPKTVDVDVVLAVLLGKNADSLAMHAPFANPTEVRVDHKADLHAMRR